jgi:hypothetical protein
LACLRVATFLGSKASLPKDNLAPQFLSLVPIRSRI